MLLGFGELFTASQYSVVTCQLDPLGIMGPRMIRFGQMMSQFGPSDLCYNNNHDSFRIQPLGGDQQDRALTTTLIGWTALPEAWKSFKRPNEPSNKSTIGLPIPLWTTSFLDNQIPHNTIQIDSRASTFKQSDKPLNTTSQPKPLNLAIGS
ncbi:hypothetical protein Q3G72_029834 [Acer saccharum]|nr:hypothetical protein Q3G72_029834 [Acer saccharum]